MHSYISELYKEVGKYENLNIFENKTNKYRRKWTASILKDLFTKNNIKHILEIGPGSGYISETIDSEIKKNKKEIHYSIMDFSDSYLDTTKEKNINVYKTITGDISTSDFTLETKFSLVVLQEVLEHTISPYQTLFNINKILDNEGILIITVPNTNNWRYIINNTRQYKAKKIFPNTHISELAPFGLFKLTSMTGFSVETFSYHGTIFNKIPYLNSFLSKELGLILKKETEPKTRWSELTHKIVSEWKKRKYNQ